MEAKKGVHQNLKKGRRRAYCREPKTQNGDRILKKTECLSSCGRAKERQKAFIIAELRQKYRLKDLLELSGIARSTYYNRRYRVQDW